MFQFTLKHFAKICSAFFLISPAVTKCQSNSGSCPDLKNGIFNSYPKNSNDHFVLKRNSDFQVETNIKTGDSMRWKINWLNDCSYTLKFISGSGKKIAEMTDFLKKHTLEYQVANVTADYYIFKGYVDKISGTPIQTDTVWRKEKASVPNNRVFEQTDAFKLRKARFSDTSKYAVLYVYRPGKFTCSAADYLVYFDNNIMYDAKNKSTYVFKLLKEGQFQMSGKIGNRETPLKLNVEFGKKYYLASTLNFALNIGNSCMPELSLVDAQKGKAVFEDLQY